MKSAFEYQANYMGRALIDEKIFPVLKANGMGYIHPADEKEAEFLRSKGYVEVDIETVGLSASELALKNSFLEKLDGVLTAEEIEAIKLLPQSAKDQLRENFQAIVGDLKTKGDSKPVETPVVTQNQSIEKSEEDLLAEAEAKKKEDAEMEAKVNAEAEKTAKAEAEAKKKAKAHK